MTYRVECEIYSNGDEREVALRRFIFAQEAADFTRSWVAEQPLDPSALPRARMYRNEGKPRGVMLSVWRNPDGEICERRADKGGGSKQPADVGESTVRETQA